MKMPYRGINGLLREMVLFTTYWVLGQEKIQYIVEEKKKGRHLIIHMNPVLLYFGVLPC